MDQEGTANPYRVLCLGAANIDRKLHSLRPLQMGTSNPASMSESPGGVARNVAENLARLGCEVSLMTAVGNDAPGGDLLAQAAALGIQTRFSLRLDGRSTGSYTAVLDARGEMLLGMAAMDLCDAMTPEWWARCRGGLERCDLVVADLNLPLETLRDLLADCRRASMRLLLVAVSVPKVAHLPSDLHGVSVLLMNRDELEALAGGSLPDLPAIDAACAALQARGAGDIVVTLGEQGVAYRGAAAGATQCLAAPRVAVVDVTGAGDAFCAGLCWSLCLQPAELERACRRGMALATRTLQSGASVCPDLNPLSLRDALAD